MVFQWTMGRRLVVGCMSILISSALLADTVLQKRVLIGVKVRITPVVQVIWGDTEKKETPVELRETLLKVLRKEFRHWYFQPKEEVDTKYTLTLDVWEKDSKEIAILAWMDDGRPDSRAVDKRTDKFLFKETIWLLPVHIASKLPSAEETKKEVQSTIDKAFPEKPADQKISVYPENLQKIFPLAKDPKWCEDQQEAFVLPLPKASHWGLKWSAFRLYSKQGPSKKRNLMVEADDNWGKYEDDLTEALLAKIPDPGDKNPGNYNPYLVFLHKYDPVDDVEGLEYETN